jgi:hypothetical protein
VGTGAEQVPVIRGELLRDDHGSCRTRAKAAQNGSLTDKTVKLVQCVDASTGNQSRVLDAGQKGVASTRYVHRTEGSGGIDEAMGDAAGITVVAGNLSGVGDAPRSGARGERKVDGGECAGLKQKAAGVRAVRPASNDVAGGIDSGCRRVGTPGKSIVVKTPPLLRNPCWTWAGST